MANIITFLRIPLSIAMLITVPFSTFFWVIYLCCGLTDIVDGSVARMLHQESSLGAIIDSIADSVFAICLAIVVIVNMALSVWLWLCILGVLLLRLFSYSVGFYKYHTFVSLHTYANKLTGAVIFFAPIMIYLFGLTITGIVLSTVSLYSSLEELVITIKSKELKRDFKSVFMV